MKIKSHIKVVKKRAKDHRMKLTKHEVVFLRRLARANIASFDFQVRIGYYIVDFVFPEKMLIVEVDGSSHDTRQEYDARRDKFLAGLGFTVWRLPNKDAGSCSLEPITKHLKASGLAYQNALTKAAAAHKALEQRIIDRNRPKPVGSVVGPYSKPARKVKIIKASKVLDQIFA